MTELGVFTVMWSEHCWYKSSRVHLKRLPTKGRRCSGAGRDAGVVDIGEGLARPSRSSRTIIRPLSSRIRARPPEWVASSATSSRWARGRRADELAAFRATRGGRNPPTQEGCVAGIGDYGNSIGIPTIGGEIVFEPSYSGNPLVNVFCLGIARTVRHHQGRRVGVGNPVYYVGAKTGRDGIHGATMASAEFDERSRRSGRPSRSATRSWKSSCSRPASK